MSSSSTLNSNDEANDAVTEEISIETNKRICKHMNDDHSISIYAMSKQKLGAIGGEITNATLKSISLKHDGCTIQVIQCNGNMCEQQKIIYPFLPSLSNNSSKEIRTKMVQIHHEVMKPQIITIIKKQPISILIVVAYTFLLYGTLIQQNILSPMPSTIVTENNANENVEGSSFMDVIYYLLNFGLNHSVLCPVGFGITLIAHTYEMLHVLYHNHKSLKLNLMNTVLWSMVVFIGGLPFWNEYKDLLQYHEERTKTKTK